MNHIYISAFICTFVALSFPVVVFASGGGDGGDGGAASSLGTAGAYGIDTGAMSGYSGGGFGEAGYSEGHGKGNESGQGVGSAGTAKTTTAQPTQKTVPTVPTVKTVPTVPTTKKEDVVALPTTVTTVPTSRPTTEVDPKSLENQMTIGMYSTHFSLSMEVDNSEVEDAQNAFGVNSNTLSTETYSAESTSKTSPAAGAQAAAGYNDGSRSNESTSASQASGRTGMEGSPESNKGSFGAEGVPDSVSGRQTGTQSTENESTTSIGQAAKEAAVGFFSGLAHGIRSTFGFFGLGLEESREYGPVDSRGVADPFGNSKKSVTDKDESRLSVDPTTGNTTETNANEFGIDTMSTNSISTENSTTNDSRFSGITEAVSSAFGVSTTGNTRSAEESTAQSAQSTQTTGQPTQSAAPAAQSNGISVEAQVTGPTGSVTQGWTSEAVSVEAGEQLHLRWSAPGYERCLPFIADNGGYSFSRLSDLSMTSGNTYSEGYDVNERPGTFYRIECEGNPSRPGVQRQYFQVQAR